MKNTLLFITMAAAMLLAATGLNAKETRTVTVTGSFDAISVAGPHTVNFQTGPAGEPLTAIGDARDLDMVEIYVKDNTLYIKTKEQRNNRGSRNNSIKGIQVYVKNPTLRTASVAGSGKINITGGLSGGDRAFKIAGSGRIEADKIDCDKIDISVAGSGSFTCNKLTAVTTDAKVTGSGRVNIEGRSENVYGSLAGSGRINAGKANAGKVDIKVTGSGRVNVSGTAAHLSASLAGSGRLDASDVKVNDVDVKLTGSGSVSVECSGELTASIHGSGKIYYTGNPSSVKGTGKVQNIVKK